MPEKVRQFFSVKKEKMTFWVIKREKPEGAKLGKAAGTVRMRKQRGEEPGD